jgi:hypothetical protein
MPRWVKVSLIVGLIVLVLAGLALAFGGMDHGPGRHFGGGSTDDGNTTSGHTPPPTHHPTSGPGHRLASLAPRQSPLGTA